MTILQASAVLGGWVLDGIVGDPRRWHPVAGFGRGALRLERMLYRDARGTGACYTAALVAGPSLATFAAEQRLSPPARAGLFAAVVWTALGGRSLAREAEAVAAALAAGDLEGARRRLPALVGRDPSDLDEKEVTRAVIESVAENTADAVVAPLVYAVIAGPAAVVAHRCANTLDAMVGHRSTRYARFGTASARLDDMLGWLPARVGALLTCALAPSVGGRATAAAATWLRDGCRHPSPNAGRVEAAFAGALGVRLGGANRYGHAVEVRGPLGDGPPPAVDDVHRAVALSRLVGWASAGLAVAALVLRPRVAEPVPAWTAARRYQS